MRTDKIYINDNDAFSKYGLFMLEGSYDELVSYPPLKKPEFNDWHEEDGIDVDLTDVHLDTREFVMKFGLSGQYRYGKLIEDLSLSAYNTFYFKEIGRYYYLRMVSNPSYEDYERLGFASIKFADDYPLRNYVYQSPLSSIASNDDYSLDDIELSNYGVIALEGTLAEITKSPDVKLNLLRKINTMQGAIYDNATVNYKDKDVKIKCLMRAASLAELWRNYDAFLYDLTRSGIHVLYCSKTGEEYNFYYSKCKVNDFCPNGKIWLYFTITLKFIDYRPSAEEFILSSQDEQIIVTQGLTPYAINIHSRE